MEIFLIRLNLQSILYLSQNKSLYMKLSKKKFALIFSLCQKHPWLSEREDAILELIDICNSYSEQELICELMHRFKYLTSKDTNASLELIIDTIINDWKLPEKQTRIIACTFDESPDSGQYISCTVLSRCLHFS